MNNEKQVINFDELVSNNNLKQSWLDDKNFRHKLSKYIGWFIFIGGLLVSTAIITVNISTKSNKNLDVTEINIKQDIESLNNENLSIKNQ